MIPPSTGDLRQTNCTLTCNDFVQSWWLTSQQPYLNVQRSRPVLATYVTATVPKCAMISSSPGDLRHNNRTWKCNDSVQFWRLTSQQPYLKVQWFRPVLATYVTPTVPKRAMISSSPGDSYVSIHLPSTVNINWHSSFVPSLHQTLFRPVTIIPAVLATSSMRSAATRNRH